MPETTMTGPIAVERLRAATFAFVAHLNCGAAGHRYLYRCTEFPELTVVKSSLRKPSRVEWSYAVGGQQLPDLQAVADALNALWPNRGHRTLAEVDADSEVNHGATEARR